ncbi:response regulator [Paenibacillus thermotolerans]|uniref:response regulator n=1 Tax=Paenibacillus thermotolerans TaxID=3027807 RepID=UPI002367F270|nr:MULTISPECIES: response regulator [unclassified Paenibacillus]
MRALIVDDEPLSVKRLGKLLGESGKVESCVTFLNPLEALEFVKTNRVDIAFLDISMPGMGGMTLSKRLSELDEEIGVVFVTSYDEYAVQAFDLSALDYLLKPVTGERLSRTLERFQKRRGGSSAETPVSVFMFNGFKIFGPSPNKEPLKLRSPKTEELFAFLLYKGAVSREEIIETLWSGLDTDKAGKNLNSTLYYIRKALADYKLEHCIEADRSEVRIAESGMYCDLYEFRRLLKEMRLHPEKPGLLERAEALYTGEFLKGRAYDWAGEETRKLEQDYIELLEASAQWSAKQHDRQKSVRYFDELLTLDPLREDIAHKLICLYIELGRKHEAIRQYRILEDSLRRELGTMPDRRLLEMITNMTLQ